MLHEFLTANREELIARCRVKVAQRSAPKATQSELLYGIPCFLDQLIETLRVEQSRQALKSRLVSGPSDGTPAASEIGASAALHGRELYEQGFTVEQVVHDYGDLCQAITSLAAERESPIEIDEFRTLNRCLDNGIADAVSEFAFQRSSLMESSAFHAYNERLGFLAHELRNHIHTATLALLAVKSGRVGLNGATASLLDRALTGMRHLIDRSLADVRTGEGMPARHQRISLADFIADVGISASFEAEAHGCQFTLGTVDRDLALEVDREMLFSAVANLLQNAFKFTAAGSEVSLSAYASGDRIRIDVADHCGGLPLGTADHMFEPFSQSGTDRTGLGLGLSIARRSVEANDGTLTVRDIPRQGCVFTVDLPRCAVPIER